MRIGNNIYLDHHATTPVDERVLVKMLPFFKEAFGNPHSANHSFGWEAAQAVDDATAQVGRLIHADADEIIFTSGATEANNLALLGMAERHLGSARRGLLLGSIDHKSSLAIGRVLKERGFEVSHVRVDQNGYLDLDDLHGKLSGGILALSVCLVNSEIGTIQKIKEIAIMAQRYGVLLHCDAAQAPCAMDMSSITEWADLVSLSAHKMYGPKGIGALYVRRSIQGHISPIIHGGGQQRNLRSGTLPTPLCVGFGAAAALLIGPDGDHERERVFQLRELFVQELHKLSSPVSLNCTKLSRHPGNANIRFEGVSADELIAILQPHLAASTGSACTSGIPEPSHVLRTIGLTNDQAAASLRFCVGRYTTDIDIHDAVQRIAEALNRISNAGVSWAKR